MIRKLELETGLFFKTAVPNLSGFADRWWGGQGGWFHVSSGQVCSCLQLHLCDRLAYPPLTQVEVHAFACYLCSPVPNGTQPNKKIILFRSSPFSFIHIKQQAAKCNFKSGNSNSPHSFASWRTLTFGFFPWHYLYI